MQQQSVAQPTMRTQRGIQLWRDYGDRIERTGPSSYLVPSCSGKSERYIVVLELGYCSCMDHARAKDLGVGCKHIIAAEIVRAKKRSVSDR